MGLSLLEHNIWNNQWRFFKRHRPVSEYPPAGQLEGDCRVCHVDWPCPAVEKFIEARLTAVR